MAKKRTPKEMTIFLPNESGAMPRTLAQELISALQTGRAETGIDLLTGNVEVRLYYDPALLAQARAWLDAHGIRYDVSFL